MKFGGRYFEELDEAYNRGRNDYLAERGYNNPYDYDLQFKLYEEYEEGYASSQPGYEHF